tara:strand:+ start:2288 stop:3274 length:987 start_codon:yes stop_codon:yes gene_type:complete
MTFLNNNKNNKISLCRNRRIIWIISLIAILISGLGFLFSWTDSSIGAPLRPGLDFTGGTQIKLERKCEVKSCKPLLNSQIYQTLKEGFDNKEFETNLITSSNIKIQFLDNYKSVLLRLPFLSSEQTKSIINSIDSTAGPLEKGGISVETIGPSLGKQLLKSSLISLLVAFTGISLYISFRFDRKYAFLALLALVHDVTIVAGLFSWLGLIYQVEVNSLFAVALLTIAGYSVNDTVVIFDRIRELSRLEGFSEVDKIDLAVSASLTRTLYTSGSTLLPLFALILFGGSSLKLFSLALAIGIFVGSWSSIALAPSLLSLFVCKTNKAKKN